MSLSDQNIVRSDTLEWTDKDRDPADNAVGPRVRFYPVRGQLQGYLASEFCKQVDLDQKQTYRVRLADGPTGYIFLKAGAMKGAKLTRKSQNAFAFGATGVARETQVPRDRETTWKLDHFRKQEANLAVVRLKEITW